MNHTICLPRENFVKNLNKFKWPLNLKLSLVIYINITISSLCSKSPIGLDTDYMILNEIHHAAKHIIILIGIAIVIIFKKVEF